jgi:cytochrome c-550 PedF
MPAIVSALPQSRPWAAPTARESFPHIRIIHPAPQNRTVMNTKILSVLAVLLSAAVAGLAQAHGNVTPQAVDTAGLPKLQGPLTVNPYRGNAKAVEIGSHAYGQNCARCHGLGAVSGGIAPDLRNLPVGDDGDEYFQMRIRNGSVRNGVTYMPPFGDIFSEEAIWAIRTYLDSVHQD